MKTRFYTKSLMSLAAAVALIIAGCEDATEEIRLSLPDTESIGITSVTFFFTDPSTGEQKNTFGYFDDDGCCSTPAERADTFLLESNRIYNCTIEPIDEYGHSLLNDKKLLENYFFCYHPVGEVELGISCPGDGTLDAGKLCSEWTTGLPGKGFIKFKIGNCRPNETSLNCYEIMLPVVIE